MCSGKVGSTCFTSGISRDTLVKNPVISYEWGNGGIVITTKRIYLWLFVTQISRNGLPSHGGDRKTFEIMLVQFQYLSHFSSLEKIEFYSL